MKNILIKFISILGLMFIFLNSVNAGTITYSSNYGLENILFTIYLIFHLVVWVYIYLKTKPIEINEKSYLASSINAVTRSLSYVWFFTIIVMSKGILLISSDTTFLDGKLFIFNLLYYITFFFLGLFALLVFIKHSSKISGLSDFIENFIFEVKNE